MNFCKFIHLCNQCTDNYLTHYLAPLTVLVFLFNTLPQKITIQILSAFNFM